MVIIIPSLCMRTYEIFYYCELMYCHCFLFCRSFTRSLGAISRPKQIKASDMDCLLILNETMLFILPGNDLLGDWLSNT